MCEHALWIVCDNQLMFVLLNGIMNSAPSSFTHAGHVHIYPYGPRNTTAHTTSLSSYPSTSSRIASVLDVHSKRETERQRDIETGGNERKARPRWQENVVGVYLLWVVDACARARV